jgi:diaminopimelate decarboxylase
VSETVDGSSAIAQLAEVLARAADRFGTPVYVMDMASVAAAARHVEDAFGSPWLLHYSLKANDLPAIAGYLAGRGWGGAVVSAGE